MINKFHEEYLDYTLGEISETKSYYLSTNSKFFKSKDYDILLEVCGWRLFIKEIVFNNFQDFFSLTYSETKIILIHYFSKKLDLSGLTPVVCTWGRQRSWY